ncbi:MAG: hypothetical protein IID46_11765 [Planctomycetes bacterium]|nr:hypothetical protein [Planctomycetota bacterium]
MRKAILTASILVTLAMFWMGVSFELLFALEDPDPVSTSDSSSNHQKSAIATLSREVPARSYDPFPIPQQIRDVDLLAQTPKQAALKSRSCIECHKTVTDPHDKAASISLGCTDCRDTIRKAGSITATCFCRNFQHAAQDAKLFHKASRRNSHGV